MPKRKQSDSDPTEIEALVGHVKQSGLREHDAMLAERGRGVGHGGALSHDLGGRSNGASS